MQQQNRIRLIAVALFLVPATVLLSSFTSVDLPGSRATASVSPYIIGDTSRDADDHYERPKFHSVEEERLNVYDSLNLQELGLSRKVFELGVKGMEKLRKKGVLRTNILSIMDLSQSSTHKRLYVIDLDNFSLLYNTWVAHGRNSGTDIAHSFSNKPRSKKTSLGFYITGDTYLGSNGYSLKLNGLEYGINNNAYRRAIVVHGAGYVNEDYIQSQGYIGRSFGCPAIPADISEDIIDHIKNGSCLFIFSPSPAYLKKSSLIR